MTTRNEIETLYAQYLEQAVNAEQNRRLTDGMFGFGKKPADDPCHTQFIEALQQILQEYAQNEPDDAAALTKEYAKLYRKWERLPVQDEIYKALQKAANT